MPLCATTLGPVEMSEGEFAAFGTLIQSHCGIKMPPAKKTMLRSRLMRRLRELGLPSFGEYLAYLTSPDGMRDEFPRMIDSVTTNKTDFFREPEHFTHLADTVIPALLRERRVIKLWSAGCSTGEEPYTLAMVMSECMERHGRFEFSVTASDISSAVLEKAALGVYDEERARMVPEAFRRKYFLRSRDPKKRLVRVVPEVREKVSFTKVNLMDEDYGLGEKMDVIFCRNVIIYFDRQRQEKLFRRLARALAPGGRIFIGHSETLAGLDVPLVQMRPTVYRHGEHR